MKQKILITILFLGINFSSVFAVSLTQFTPLIDAKIEDLNQNINTSPNITISQEITNCRQLILTSP